MFAIKASCGFGIEPDQYWIFEVQIDTDIWQLQYSD